QEAQRGVMGDHPLAIAGGGAQDRQEADARTRAEEIEGKPQPRRAGQRGCGDEPAGKRQQADAGGKAEDGERKPGQKPDPVTAPAQPQYGQQRLHTIRHHWGSLTTRSQRAASASSWVARMSVRPSASRNSPSATAFAVSTSRCAVGSSARMISAPRKAAR